MNRMVEYLRNNPRINDNGREYTVSVIDYLAENGVKCDLSNYEMRNMDIITGTRVREEQGEYHKNYYLSAVKPYDRYLTPIEHEIRSDDMYRMAATVMVFELN